MDLFEHQAKELFAKYGVAVPRGKVAWSPEEAESAAAEVGGTVGVKAQVQIGGRGEGGGARPAREGRVVSRGGRVGRGRGRRHRGGQGPGADRRPWQGGRHPAGRGPGRGPPGGRGGPGGGQPRPPPPPGGRR